MEVTFLYQPSTRTTSMLAGDVCYTILWSWPEVGCPEIVSSVYVKEDGVWHKH